ncbi:hypothetical protein N9W34_06615 [Rickettsiales bacterium]|nr:hypothetical protein [Rickettsiales bacterium]
MKRPFIYIIIMALLFATGCNRGKIFSEKSIFAPKAPTMGNRPDDAPEVYKKGWDDGCETGLSTMVMSYAKAFYQYKKDPELDNDPMYYKAWKDAYTYCRHFSFRHNWDTLDSTQGDFGNLCIICPQQ